MPAGERDVALKPANLTWGEAAALSFGGTAALDSLRRGKLQGGDAADTWVAMTSSRKIIAGPAAERPADVRLLAALARVGEFRPVIDRRYPFEQIAEAHRDVDTGHKRGNVIIDLEHDD